jgi:hypothetical protein
MKNYILEYIEYLEDVCSLNEKALYEISLYKLKSAKNYDADTELYNTINFGLCIDICSYNVFEKRIKMKKLLSD